ncbi:hypothetical protein ACFQ08_05095 [Streptosporangium algeriense]|uniref:Uncharacterized protein n=1 Tax=Streptosporangium algeriense TaxID=1682748 RepID=A0ABW3DJJ6_9ACTN
MSRNMRLLTVGALAGLLLGGSGVAVASAEPSGLGGPVRMVYGGNVMLSRTEARPVFEIPLQPGAYRADAQIAISPWASGGTGGKEYIGDCTISIAGRGYLANTATTSHRLYLNLHTVFTLTSNDTLRVRCTGGPTDGSFGVRVGGLSSVTIQQVSSATVEMYPA